MALYGIDADNASPASNGGRGLKHHSGLLAIRQAIGIARQQWRARIETWTTALMSCAAKRIARQQWRARIETSSPPKVTLPRRASPASNGGRGLKPRLHGLVFRLARASPASNGGRGLKPAGSAGDGKRPGGIARQQWRARIETRATPSCWHPAPASPASNGGRGLKRPTWRSAWPWPWGIARQQWRARIETRLPEGRPSPWA